MRTNQRRSGAGAIQADKVAAQGALVPLFLYRRIAQVPPYLQAVHAGAQHCIHRKQWDSTQRLVYATGMRVDE